ncbi:triose-phosphate transporter family-domain-containing protein [Melampsora americana]|nr:triose-phosphate transporter family-domain-containing protein [Melampsora americana]
MTTSIPNQSNHSQNLSFSLISTSISESIESSESGSSPPSNSSQASSSSPSSSITAHSPPSKLHYIHHQTSTSSLPPTPSSILNQQLPHPSNPLLHHHHQDWSIQIQSPLSQLQRSTSSTAPTDQGNNMNESYEITPNKPRSSSTSFNKHPNTLTRSTSKDRVSMDLKHPTPISSTKLLLNHQNIRPFYSNQQPSSLASLPKSTSLPLGLTSSSHPSPYAKLAPRVSSKFDSSTAWLIYYFAFNLGLTIYNKRVLLGFPFPWTLTGIHALASTFGSQFALNRGFFKSARLNRRESGILVAFSVLYTVNIAVSNLSLHLVTVPFHQVVRATTPLFTIILSIVYFQKSYPIQTYLSLFIVVAGVGFSTYGDYGWTTWGLVLTLLGTILASLKTVITNLIQVGKLKLNPLDLLLRMSPLAFIQCVVWSYWTGEMSRVREFGAHEMDKKKAIALAINGVIAFGLNVVSFTANKKTSALTMTVAANVKQVLTIVLAIFIFNLVITPTNLFGITLTLVGGAYYAKVELDRKKTSDQVINNGMIRRDDEKPGLPSTSITTTNDSKGSLYSPLVKVVSAIPSMVKD